jgi:hypothetical protein
VGKLLDMDFWGSCPLDPLNPALAFRYYYAYACKLYLEKSSVQVLISTPNYINVLSNMNFNHRYDPELNFEAELVA